MTIKLNISEFELTQTGDTYTLEKVIKYAGGDELMLILKNANIKQVKQALIKRGNSNMIEVSEALKALNIK